MQSFTITVSTSARPRNKEMAARKVAAVIGYGPGIGHSCAALWASKGYAVALVSRTASKLEAATAQIPNSLAVSVEGITDNARPRAAMKSIADNLGPVDTLLYNAGNGVWKRFDEITVAAKLDMAMKTNVYGLLTCAQWCTPDMVQTGGGNIIITGATAFAARHAIHLGVCGREEQPAVSWRSMARQLWKDNIHVARAIIDAQVGDGEGKMHPTHRALPTSPVSARWSFQPPRIQCYTSDASLPFGYPLRTRVSSSPSTTPPRAFPRHALIWSAGDKRVSRCHACGPARPARQGDAGILLSR